MYVLVAGNPWDGMTIFVRADGRPFDSTEEAEQAFMLDGRIGSDYWEIVPVEKVQKVEAKCSSDDQTNHDDEVPMSETERVEAQWDIEDASKP